jgi:S-adenosylmethionine decarboxylase
LIGGRHIKVIGIGDPERLRSVPDIRGLLAALVAALGMRPLGPPHLYEVEENLRRIDCEPFEDEGGVTGVMVLSTSHCAVHTWPLRARFVLDVFSCRNFDPSIVGRLVRETFATTRLRISDLSHALTLDDGSSPVRTPAVASTANGASMNGAVRTAKRSRGSRSGPALAAPTPARPQRGDS